MSKIAQTKGLKPLPTILETVILSIKLHLQKKNSNI